MAPILISFVSQTGGTNTNILFSLSRFQSIRIFRLEESVQSVPGSLEEECTLIPPRNRDDVVHTLGSVVVDMDPNACYSSMFQEVDGLGGGYCLGERLCERGFKEWDFVLSSETFLSYPVNILSRSNLSIKESITIIRKKGPVSDRRGFVGVQT